MAHTYRAVGWNRNKVVYDRTLVLGVAVWVVLFVATGFALHPEATAETLLIRAFGTCAFAMLHVVLAIGPLARLDARFLPLLYNRRHLGVATFVVGLAHGLFAVVQFHALGNLNPLVSVLSANPRLDSVAQFPFQPLGLAALVILFLMAATSHDFWLANLTAPVWKALHMLVYVAWGLLVLHVALGVLQAETSPLYVALIGGGTAAVAALHVAAALRERRADRPLADGGPGGDAAAGSRWVDVCGVDDVPEKRALIATLAGERVAVFRHDGRISVLSNVCQHQNGPLGEGRIVDGLVTCPWHGYQYEPRCGRSPAPFTERVPTFEARVADGRVLVDPLPLPPGTDVEPARIDGASEKEPAARGEMFVGYLPEVPPGIARFVGLRVRVLLGATALLAVLISAAQAPFGTAVFEYGTERTFEGWIHAIPYPTLGVERPGWERAGPRVSRWLLSGVGKHGADAEVVGLEGKHVRLRGTLVYRDDRTMVEVVPGSVVATGRETATVLANLHGEMPLLPDLTSEDLGLHTFVGEIVDSKCFLGVMKPGNLKPHRACATRCIAGGVPPVLLVRRDDGTALYLVLTGADGSAVNDAVLDRIAEPLEITGRVVRWGDLLVLRADPATYARLER